MTVILSLLVAVLAFVPAGSGEAAAGAPSGKVRFTVLYDNYLHREGTRADWGFSCLVEGLEKTILFDTGTNPQILLHNAGILGVDFKSVDIVVISHNHGDHTGGLAAVLERNPSAAVFAPKSFPPDFGRRVEGLGASFRAVGGPVEICPGAHLTGELGEEIVEQSLLVDTPGGLVVVTGCSHPGIVNILRRAKEVRNRPVRLVFGGFHLGNKTDAEMLDIIAAFKEMKVESCGATHCTGDKQIAAFREAYGAKFVSLGAGRIIEIE
jgi:7,8-dihydropterin-6-yl-methyl-4-(beta-D-ribofuranosyl)aminobenzene 5'-phosphate synthase